MEELKSLKEILEVLQKRFLLIAFLTVLAATISGAVTYFFVDPVYESTTQLLVSRSDPGGANLNNENLQTDLQLITTYSDIMKSPAILGKVKTELGLRQPVSELNENITITRSTDSQVVNITAQASNATEAVRISNATAEIVIAEIPQLMDVENISILSNALIDDVLEPISPNLELNVALAALAGLLVGLGAAFLIEYVKTEVKNKQDVENALGIPVIGLIPLIRESEPASTRFLQNKGGGAK